jgi:hypothetical protein
VVRARALLTTPAQTLPRAFSRQAKKGIEGPAFVCLRSSAPEHRLWVTNRTSQRYLVVDVTPTLELQSRGDLFLFRDTAHPERGLHAIWSPEEDKANAALLLDSFRAIVAQCVAAAGDGGVRETAANGAAAARSAAGADAGNALLNMLKRGAGSAPTASVGASGAVGAGAGALPPSVAAFFSSSAAAAAVPASSAPSTISPSVAALFASAPVGGSTAGARGGDGVGAGGSASGRSGGGDSGAPLDKAALRIALLDLVNDDAFLTLLHSRYAKAVQQTAKSKK